MIYVMMALCFAFGPSPFYLVMGAMVSGAAYGLLLPATRELVAELSSPELRTTAQGMADAVYLSLSGVISSGAVGAFSDSFGLNSVILGFAAL